MTQIPWTLIIATLGLLGFPGCLVGCAAERTAEAIATTAKDTATALIQKSIFTQSTASVHGRMTDPHYKVLAVMVNGVLLDVGLDGAELTGDLTGSGTGEDKPLDADTISAIRENLTTSEWERILKAIAARHPATNPAGGK